MLCHLMLDLDFSLAKAYAQFWMVTTHGPHKFDIFGAWSFYFIIFIIGIIIMIGTGSIYITVELIMAFYVR